MSRKNDTNKCHSDCNDRRDEVKDTNCQRSVDRIKKTNLPCDKNASDGNITYNETTGAKDTMKSHINENVKGSYFNQAFESETKNLGKSLGHEICKVESLKNFAGRSEHLHGVASNRISSSSSSSSSTLHTVIIDCTSMAFIDSAGVATLAEVSVSFLFIFFFLCISCSEPL